MRRVLSADAERQLTDARDLLASLRDALIRFGASAADEATLARSIRQLDLKKAPSVSETLDWARTLLLLNLDSIDEKTAKDTLHILLKYQTDIAKATKELTVEEK